MMTTLVILAVVVAVVVCFVCEKRRRAAFAKRFPPMTDAKFVSRCSPGTDPAVALKVRRILADCFGVEDERIHPSTRLIDFED